MLFSMIRLPRNSTPFPYTTLFRSRPGGLAGPGGGCARRVGGAERRPAARGPRPRARDRPRRSEEHTSELQSRGHLVCRLLLEKKNTNMRERARGEQGTMGDKESIA